MIETFTKNSLFVQEDQRQKRWAVPYHYEALNSRVEQLIIAQAPWIRGQVVLDLGCHFGTFAYAAWHHGAQRVLGLDSEAGLIEQANRLFDHYQVPSSAYAFEVQEALAALEIMAPDSVDTVLCLGLFYYLPDPLRALQLMAKVARKAIILDTFTVYYAATVAKDREAFLAGTNPASFQLPLVYYPLTRSQKKDYHLPPATQNAKGEDLSQLALPTIPALEQFFRILNLRSHRLSWKAYCRPQVPTWQAFGEVSVKRTSHWADVYGNGIRVAYVLSKA